MYSNNFVVCIISNGETVHESKNGTVKLPFGSEYSIRLRNKNSRRAVAKVFIDEENVSEAGIIVPAYGYVDLERPLSKAVKFKFVSSNTYEARAAGKDHLEDDAAGVIRVEWQLEVAPPKVEKTTYIPYPYVPWQPNPIAPMTPPWENPYPYQPIWSCDTPRGMSHNSSQPLSFCDTGKSLRSNEGVTVDGGYSDQTFSSAYINLATEVTTIRLTLVGGEAPKKPKVGYCDNCGTKVLSSRSKFCHSCGASLLTKR